MEKKLFRQPQKPEKKTDQPLKPINDMLAETPNKYYFDGYINSLLQESTSMLNIYSVTNNLLLHMGSHLEIGEYKEALNDYIMLLAGASELYSLGQDTGDKAKVDYAVLLVKRSTNSFYQYLFKVIKHVLENNSLNELDNRDLYGPLAIYVISRRILGNVVPQPSEVFERKTRLLNNLLKSYPNLGYFDMAKLLESVTNQQNQVVGTFVNNNQNYDFNPDDARWVLQFLKSIVKLSGNISDEEVLQMITFNKNVIQFVSQLNPLERKRK